MARQSAAVRRIVWQIESTIHSRTAISFRGLDTIDISPENFSFSSAKKRGRFTVYNGGPKFQKFLFLFNLNKGRRANGRPVVDPIKSRWFNTLALDRQLLIDRQTMLNNVFRGVGTAPNHQLISKPLLPFSRTRFKVYDYNFPNERRYY